MAFFEPRKASCPLDHLWIGYPNAIRCFRAAFNTPKINEAWNSKGVEFIRPNLLRKEKVALFCLGLLLVLPVINAIVSIAVEIFFKKQGNLSLKERDDSFKLRNLLKGVESVLVPDAQKMFPDHTVKLFYSANPKRPLEIRLELKNDKISQAIANIVDKVAPALEPERDYTTKKDIVDYFRAYLFLLRYPNFDKDVMRMVRDCMDKPLDDEFNFVINSLNAQLKKFLEEQSLDTNLFNIHKAGDTQFWLNGNLLPINVTTTTQNEVLIAAINKFIEIFLSKKFGINY